MGCDRSISGLSKFEFLYRPIRLTIILICPIAMFKPLMKVIDVNRLLKQMDIFGVSLSSEAQKIDTPGSSVVKFSESWG